MKSYPIIYIATFKDYVDELERFIESLPVYQSEIDMKILKSDETNYIFERSWRYDYNSAISIVNDLNSILPIEDELLKRNTEYIFDSKYLDTGNIILVFVKDNSTSIYYLDMLNFGRWDVEYNSVPEDSCDPYVKLIYHNYTEITKNNNDITTLKDVVRELKKYGEGLKDE